MVFIIGVIQQHCDCVLLCIIFRHCKDMDKYLKAKSFLSFFISPYSFYILHTLICFLMSYVLLFLLYFVFVHNFI